MADYYNGADQAAVQGGNEYAGQAQSYANGNADQNGAQAAPGEQKEEGKLIQK